MALTQKVIADRLKKLRISSNKKQTEIAEHLGVLPRTIRFYESGERELNIEVINMLANLFNVSTDYLLGHSDDRAIDEAMGLLLLSQKANNQQYHLQ